MTVNPSIIERFWKKVPARPEEGCWEWSASTKPFGYGQLAVNNRPAYAHRISYEIHYGPIPEGMFVRHTCDNPLCVRPTHLIVGTQLDNMKDMISRGRARHPPAYGEKNPYAKLTDREAKQIIADPRPPSVLSPIYGVSRQTIWNVRRRYRARAGKLVEA